MSDMRISDLISILVDSYDETAIRRLERMIPDSSFGIALVGLPDGQPGETFTVDGSGTITMQCVGGPNNQPMIKACADPDLFAQNFPNNFNALMTGKELVEMAQKLPEAEGILICSATSFHSYPLFKEAYPRVSGANSTTFGTT